MKREYQAPTSVFFEPSHPLSLLTDFSLAGNVSGYEGIEEEDF